MTYHGMITAIHLPGWICRLNGLQSEALSSGSLGVEGKCSLIIMQKGISVDFYAYIIVLVIRIISSRGEISWGDFMMLVSPFVFLAQK